MEVVIGRGSCDGTSHHRQAPGRRLGEAVRHWPTFEEVLASALTDCALTQSQGELELELSDRNLSLPQTMMSTRLHHGQPHPRCPLLGNIQVAPLARMAVAPDTFVNLVFRKTSSKELRRNPPRAGRGGPCS
jgi:hypothetical protein